MAGRPVGGMPMRLGPRDFSPGSVLSSSPTPPNANGPGSSPKGNKSPPKGSDNDDQDQMTNNPQHNQPTSNNQNNPSGQSGLPSGCMNPAVPAPQPNVFCKFVNENDGSLKYSSNWTLASSDPNGLARTLHFTGHTGASITMEVNDTQVVYVFGLVPPGPNPPLASYSIDSGEAVTPNIASATTCIPNQRLFMSETLSTNQHNLTIIVTNASPGSPYIIDYLWLCGSSGPGKQSQNSTDATTMKNHTLKPSDGVIIGSVLGGVFLLLGIALSVLFFIRRRRKRQQRLRKLHLAASPVSSWLHWNSQSGEDQNVFTSSESIMGNNPTYSSSTETKGGQGRREITSLPASMVLPANPSRLSRPPPSIQWGSKSSTA